MTHGPLTLIVEDQPRLREILMFQIGSAGFRVRTARHGGEALRLVRKSPPDLVLTDWMMPEVDGLEHIRRTRASPELSRIPVIFLSAKSTSRDRLNALHAGANDDITKPWERDELVLRIRNVVEWTQRLARGPGA